MHDMKKKSSVGKKSKLMVILSFFIYTFADKSKAFVYCFEELTASDLFDKTDSGEFISSTFR